MIRLSLLYSAIAFLIPMEERSLALEPPPDKAQYFTICTDTNFWAPFTFVMDGESRGLHVELAQRAFTALGHRTRIEARPWKRCMAGGKAGDFDAVLSASYSEARAADFLYPENATLKPTSPYRVTQAEYVVVVRAADRFDWDGNDRNLPAPVGVPLGYQIASALRGQGIVVHTAVKYVDLFRMLARGRVNSLVVVRPTAEIYLKNRLFESRLTILDRAHRTTSYFMLVSKKGRISPDLAWRLWRRIAEIRENKAAMDAIMRDVLAELDDCFRELKRCT